jgi:geranylgeranyl diphosphate synthase type I
LTGALTSIAPRIDARLTALFDSEQARWSEVDTDLAEPFAALRDYVLSGGKRLRPAFCYWAFMGAGGGAGDPAAIDAGAALEMLHTAALVHDDVIDASVSRHGTETVHMTFAGRHRAGGWAGDSGRFGDGVAIILGDLALVYSRLLLVGASPEARVVFDEMTVEVNVGQYLDIVGTALGLASDPDVGMGRAGRINRYKTAKYTVERPLHLGAALAAPHRLAELQPALSRFGVPLGEAFQLRDDLLGAFGDPAVTGKPVGDDLREGKPTVLANLAFQWARGSDADDFGKLFGRADLDDAGVSRLLAIIESTGARSHVENAIHDLVGAATAELPTLPLTGESISALGELAAFVAGRVH